MSDNVSGGLPRRGETYLTGPGRTAGSTDAAHVEGATKRFDDVAPGQTSGAKVRRSNRQSVCMLVRNASGIALLPKRTVKWKSGLIGKQVDGYCSASAEFCAGVVDEHLPAAGCPANDLFWLTVEGPTLMLTSLAGDAENVIASGDLLVALTAATSQATTAGRVVAQAATTNVTYATSVALNNFGRAMSAKTTANTNADVLADVRFLK